MPQLTRLFIKSSFIYLLLALLTSLWIALQSNLGFTVPGLFPVFIHLFVMGWLTFLIFGVGYWMFPKFSPAKPRGNEGAAWATFVLANIGLLTRALAEPMAAIHASGFWGWLLVLSALAQWLAGLLFVINSWPRIKER